MLQTVDAIDAVLAGQLGPAADGLVGWGAAGAGAGGEVHLAFGVLVHQAAWGSVSGCFFACGKLYFLCSAYGVVWGRSIGIPGFGGRAGQGKDGRGREREKRAYRE